MSVGGPGALRSPRPTAVAGMFYPGDALGLAAEVEACLAAASRGDGGKRPGSGGRGEPADGGEPGGGGGPGGRDVDRSASPGPVAGILVPHAGFVYSGAVAAAGWLAALPESATRAQPAPTVVLLGTNHGAAWLDGVGTWDRGPWRTPLGEVAIDQDLTAAIVDLGLPFAPDATCHLGEHSLEVQLPFVSRLAPGSGIAALSIGTGTGRRAVAAGERLGELLAARRAAGVPIVLAISSDMAHYPRADVAERVTAALLPHILALDPEALAVEEAATARREPGVSCGMCGIEPTVLGLAALRAMGATRAQALASATSADAGGDPRRTVGYLAVAFGA